MCVFMLQKAKNRFSPNKAQMPNNTNIGVFKFHCNITYILYKFEHKIHKTQWAASWENQLFAYAKTKTQISFAVTAKLISTFVFTTLIVFQSYRRNEQCHEKTGLRGFRPGATQAGLYSHRRWLEAWNFGLGKQRDCTIHVTKTKALISCAVTVQLICVFVFVYAKKPVFSTWLKYERLNTTYLQIGPASQPPQRSTLYLERLLRDGEVPGWILDHVIQRSPKI